MTHRVTIRAEINRKPARCSTSEANRNEQLGARLPYVLTGCRWAHVIEKMVFDYVGCPRTAADLQRDLQNWINCYVCAEPNLASVQQLAERPLAAAEVRVVQNPDSPAYYTTDLFIRYFSQFTDPGVTIHVRLELPASPS